MTGKLRIDFQPVSFQDLSTRISTVKNLSFSTPRKLERREKGRGGAAGGEMKELEVGLGSFLS